MTPLTAPSGAPLWPRVKKEVRIVPESPEIYGPSATEVRGRGKSSWWVQAKPFLGDGWNVPPSSPWSHTPPTLTPGLPPPPFQEIGDVENWARSIELDMRTIATALEYVYKGQLQSAPS